MWCSGSNPSAWTEPLMSQHRWDANIGPVTNLIALLDICISPSCPQGELEIVQAYLAYAFLWSEVY